MTAPSAVDFRLHYPDAIYSTGALGMSATRPIGLKLDPWFGRQNKGDELQHNGSNVGVMPGSGLLRPGAPRELAPSSAL